MKNKKIITVISIIITIMLLVCLIFIKRNKIIKIARRMLNLETKEITYEVDLNQNDKIVLLLKITDTESGISKIELPDGDKLICNGREQVGLDYIIEDYGTYTFISESINGEKIEKTLGIDEILEKAVENEKLFRHLASNEFIAKKIVSTDRLFEKIEKNNNNEDFFNYINIDGTEELILVDDEKPYYTFFAKANQSYFLQCYGAQGGSNYYRTAPGGTGGYSCGTIIPTQDTTLYIYKGGVGISTVACATAPGGYNGGGALQYGWGDSHEMRSSGGGATHIALVPRIVSKFRK